MTAMPTSEDTLILRAPEPDDVDRIYLWENDPGMWRYGYSPAPLSRHQIWEYVNRSDSDPVSQGELRLMMQADCDTVGAVDLYDIDMRNRRAFVGIMTAPLFRRRRYALRALRLMADYCRDNLGLERIAATVADDNPASLGLFAAAGFTCVAHLPDWVRRGKDSFVGARILMLHL